jgi:ankyrin repeat protein
VREILSADPSRANAADPCWRRPLSGATSNGHTNIVRLLLEHGADPNAKEAVCQGGYSLHQAAWKGFKEIVELLLEKGAIPEHWVDSSGDSVFAAQRHPEILHLLYSYGATMELKVYSASHRIDVIAEVLKLKPSLANDVLPYGWDDNGTEELALNIMRLAIRYGARFEQASEWNLRWTALKYPKVYKLLQQHGANPDFSLMGVAGDMSRRYDNAENQLRLIAFLVEECGANVNYRDEEGRTPLAAAAGEGHRRIVEYLLSKGANPNLDAPEWAKPLTLAERRGHTEIADLLRRSL